MAKKEDIKEQKTFDKNYATNEKVAARALKVCMEMIPEIRNNRKAKEEEWLEDLSLWGCQLTQAQMYEGRSNLFVPELHDQVESSVSRFQQATFPSPDYIDCLPLHGTQDAQAYKIKKAVWHELDVKNNLPVKHEVYNRNKILFGTSVYKASIINKPYTMYSRDPNTGKPVRQAVDDMSVQWKVKDIFHSYIYPETAENIYEAKAILDEAFVEKDSLENGEYANLDKVMEMPQDYSIFHWVDSVRLTQANLATAAASYKRGVLISELWMDFDIEEGVKVPCVIVLANMSTVIRIKRNMFWDQLPPFLFGNYVKYPNGVFYGMSLPQKIRSLQYMMTDLANQTMDSLNYALNPICLIDPGFAADVNGFKLMPGAKWFAAPGAVDFTQFPDLSISGFRGMDQVRNMIQQFSDTAPAVAPQLSGKVRSATQANAISTEVTANMKNMVRSDEMTVLAPMAQKTHMLMKQFFTNDFQILSQGPDNGDWITENMKAEELLYSVKFIWKGSQASERTAIRSQQLLNFYNMALQKESMSPGQIDLNALFKIVADQAFDMRDIPIFVKEIQEKTADPALENIGLMQGRDMPINMGDVYGLHVEIHRDAFEEAKKQGNKDAMLAIANHIEKHEKLEAAKQQVMEQRAQLEAMQATGEMQAGEGAPGQEGRPFQSPGNGASEADVMSGMRPSGQNRKPVRR